MMPKINEIPVEPEPLAIIQKRYDRQGVPKKLNFSAGAFVLSDDEGNVLCGPISRGAAHLLALDIVSGASRTATRPGLALHFATVILGMTLEPAAGPDIVAAAIETVKLFADEPAEAAHG